MTFKTENIIEITWVISQYNYNKQLSCIPYTELKEIINALSNKFEILHCNTDWNELDYSEEIAKFINREMALELWRRFEDVPINPSPIKPNIKEIGENWNGFSKGTIVGYIYRWFEERFDISVAELMGQQEEKLCHNLE